MILTYNTFLEKRGFPDAILPYSEIAYAECEKRLDYYFERKGKFANYTDDIKLTLEDIKPYIKIENFKEFPVEELNIKFSIKSTTAYRYRYNISSDGSAHEIINFSIETDPRVSTNTAIAQIDITLMIGHKISIDAEKMKEELKSVINHELLHISEYCREMTNPKYRKADLIEQQMFREIDKYVFPFNDGVKLKISEFPGLFGIIYNLYTLSDSEIRAMIAQYKNSKPGYSSSDLIQYKPEYDVEKIIEETKTMFSTSKLPEGLYNEYYNEFGDALYGYYDTISEKYHYAKSNVYLKLRGKNLKDGLEFLVKLLNDRYEYLRRKVAKVNV